MPSKTVRRPQRSERSERRRVDPSRTRQSAQGGGGFVAAFFKLSKDVRCWYPEKKGTFDIDILGYEVTLDKHPDRKLDVTPGTLWWRMPFVVFKHIGTADETIVSAASIGEDCPMMDEYRSLAENYKENKKAIADLQMQKWMAFAIRDPDDEEKVAVFAQSIGKFWGSDAGLKNELDLTDDENLEFYEYAEGKGRTLRCRFSDIDFTGNDGKAAEYLGVTKIEFVPREDLDESEWIDKVPSLDAILNIRPYDEVKRLWLGLDGEGEEQEESPKGKTLPPRSRTTSGSSAGKSTGKGNPKKDEDDEKGEDESEETEESEFAEGDVVSCKIKGKKITGRIIKIEGDDCELEDDGGDTHDAQLEDLTLVEKADPDADEPDAGDNDQENEPEDKPEPKSDKGRGKTTKKRIPKVGDKIEDDQGRWGEVIKVDAKSQDVTVKRKTGKTGELDFGEVVKYLNDEDSGDAGDDDKGSEQGSEPEFEAGDKVTWNKGKSSGVITKVMDDEVKVKNDDGSGIDRVPLKDLKPKK
jgi:hypothetical protein